MVRNDWCCEGREGERRWRSYRFVFTKIITDHKIVKQKLEQKINFENTIIRENIL